MIKGGIEFLEAHPENCNIVFVTEHLFGLSLISTVWCRHPWSVKQLHAKTGRGEILNIWVIYLRLVSIALENRG